MKFPNKFQTKITLFSEAKILEKTNYLQINHPPKKQNDSKEIHTRAREEKP